MDAPAPAVRTARVSLVLRCVGLVADADDSLVRHIARFLTRVPTWTNALGRASSEATAHWAVQWLTARGIPEQSLSYVSTARVRKGYSPIDRAAKRGYLSVVQWLHFHGTTSYSVYAMKHAARRHHTDVVHFLCAHLPPLLLSHALIVTTRAGHLAAVQYLHETKQQPITMTHWLDAAHHGHMDVFQYLLTCTLPADTATDDADTMRSMMASAVHGGHRPFVQWLHVTFPDARACSKTAFHQVITSGGVDVVAFLLEQRYELDYVAAMDHAAGCGLVEMVQLFHNTSTAGCTTKALDHAAASGSLEIVRLLSEQRIEGCTTAAMDGAATIGSLEVVQYLHENRTEGCTTAAMDGAAKNGHLDVVRFLMTHRTEGCTTNAMDSAATNGHLHVVQFLHQHRTEGCTASALSGAAMHGHLDMVHYLYETGRCDNRDILPDDVTRACILQERMELLQYFYSKRLIRFMVGDLVYAVALQRVEMIEFLYAECVVKMPEQRVVWMCAAVETAARLPQPTMLVLLEAKRLDGEVVSRRTIGIASTCWNLETAEYLLTHGYEGSTTEMMNLAAARGRFDLVRFLHEHRSDGCTHHAMARAARFGHLAIVEFLAEHRSEGCVQHALRTVAPEIVDAVAALRCPCVYCSSASGLHPETGALPPWDDVFDDY